MCGPGPGGGMARLQSAWHTDDRLQEEMAAREHFAHRFVDLYFLPAILSLPGKVIIMAAMIVIVAFSVLGYISLEQGKKKKHLGTSFCARRFGVLGKGRG